MIKSKSTRFGDIVVVFVCIILIFICLLPMLNVLARSLSDAQYLIRNEVLLWPKGINIEAYKTVLNNERYVHSLWYTALLTVGCTLNHAVHHIDMLGWMMGMPDRITSILANTGHDNAEVEDLSVSVAEYPGALAVVTASVVDHGEDQALIFQCEKAKLAFPYSVFASETQPNGFPLAEPDEAFKMNAERFLKQIPPLTYEMHTGQLENILKALENDEEPAITGEDGRKTIELITAIYKSGSTRQTVMLPISRNDSFYTVEGIRAAVPHFHEKTKSVENQSGELSFGNFRKGEK